MTKKKSIKGTVTDRKSFASSYTETELGFSQAASTSTSVDGLSDITQVMFSCEVFVDADFLEHANNWDEKFH